jgi:hypothetical protein
MGAALLFLVGVLLKGRHPQIYEVTTKATELIVLAAGLFSVLLVREQLIAQEEQMSENHKQLLADHQWKTYVSYHQLFSEGAVSEAVRQPMYDFATEHGFINCFDDLGTPMNRNALELCINETAAWGIVRPYLDGFERFCAAVNGGIIDDAYAMGIEGTRVIRNYTVFEHLIKHIQTSNSRAYLELDKLAQKWAMLRRVKTLERKQHEGIGPGTDTRIECPR